MKIKAKMRDNLIQRYKEIMPLEYSPELGTFLLSIENKVVTLVFTGEDAFEENDNNWWLPKCLWDEI